MCTDEVCIPCLEPLCPLSRGSTVEPQYKSSPIMLLPAQSVDSLLVSKFLDEFFHGGYAIVTNKNSIEQTILNLTSDRGNVSIKRLCTRRAVPKMVDPKMAVLEPIINPHTSH